MKIAIFRSAGIGDFVQTTPLLQQIRADYPGAEITFFTSDNVRAFAENCPWAEIVCLPIRLFDRRRINTALIRAWWEVRRRGPWDILISLETGWARALGSLLVSARKKAGVYAEVKRPFQLYHHTRTFIPNQRGYPHTSAIGLELWTLATGHADRGYGYDIRYLLASPVKLPPLPSRFVCLVPGAGNVITPGHLKRWPLVQWQELAGLLRQEGLEAVWLGSREDATEFALPDEPYNLMGRTSLFESIHLIPKAQALVANDSGLYHVALGLGGPAIGIFGPNDPADTGPFRAIRAAVVQSSLPCVPCRRAECLVDIPELNHLRRPYCLTTLPPTQVMDSVRSLLSS